MNTFFTSDLHFGHANVIQYAGRPFKDAHEMNEALVANWNAVVQPDDEVYVVGDFALCRKEEAARLAERLNGQKYLVRGNHDREVPGKAFGWIKDMHTVKVPDADAPLGVQRIVLCHYAMRVWDRCHYGTWHLYGHSHGSLPDDPGSLSWDVGVDANGFVPLGVPEIAAIMARKTFVPVDHHRQRGEGKEDAG
jgi:calcineurin-like phosphoesterase family protein